MRGKGTQGAGEVAELISFCCVAEQKLSLVRTTLVENIENPLERQCNAALEVEQDAAGNRPRPFVLLTSPIFINRPEIIRPKANGITLQMQL